MSAIFSAVLLSVASAAVLGNATVTDHVTDFTTYCPNPTSFIVNNSTVHVTEATTITITSCPGTCTIKPVPTVTNTSTEYTTYCPSPTTLTVNNSTITVTAPTTLTITSCDSSCIPAPTTPHPISPTPHPAPTEPSTVNVAVQAGAAGVAGIAAAVAYLI